MPPLKDLKRLLGELPKLKETACNNVMSKDVLDRLVTPPKYTNDVKTALSGRAAAEAAPQLIPALWAALHVHATALLTSPDVQLNVPKVVSVVVESIARPEAAHAAALLAAVEAYGDMQYLQLPLARLYEAVSAHTLSAGMMREVPLVHSSSLKDGAASTARLDDDANRVVAVKEWDNAKLSTAAILWALDAVRSVHCTQTHRFQLYNVLPLLKGVPARGDPERSRAALRESTMPLQITKVVDRQLPVHEQQLEHGARLLLRKWEHVHKDKGYEGLSVTAKRFDISARTLQRLYR